MCPGGTRRGRCRAGTSDTGTLAAGERGEGPGAVRSVQWLLPSAECRVEDLDETQQLLHRDGVVGRDHRDGPSVGRDRGAALEAVRITTVSPRDLPAAERE